MKRDGTQPILASLGGHDHGPRPSPAQSTPPNTGQRAMERHAHARRYQVGDSFTHAGRPWTIASVAIVPEWHVVLQLHDGEKRVVLELDPEDNVLDVRAPEGRKGNGS